MFMVVPETDAEDPEPGVFHHHGRGPGHPGSAPEQLRDPHHAAQAGHLAAQAPRRGLRVHAVQRQEQEGQPAPLQVGHDGGDSVIFTLGWSSVAACMWLQALRQV